MNTKTNSHLGQVIGRIRLVDVLGEGGMGSVYLGIDETLQRRVAVKVIRPEHCLRAESKARFLREARILSQLDHPHICKVHDYIESEGGDFLVLELIEGQSLKRALQQGIAETHKLTIARQLLEVLVAVHAQNVVHRDLKPENVMLTAAGDIKVLDFGLARSVEERAQVLDREEAEAREEESAPTGENLALQGGPERAGEQASYVQTRLGTILGTAGYMSPEQAMGEVVTAASDMYSYGLILQELFTGQRPFPSGLRPRELLLKAAAGETREITGLAPDLTAFISRLKAVAPAARPSSLDASEMLQQIIDRPKRRRRQAVVAATWAVLLLLVCGMWVQSCRVAAEAQRARQAAERADREAQIALQVREFLVELFEVSDPGKARGSTITAREILDAGAARVAENLQDQPEIQAEIIQTIGQVYQNLGLYEQAESLLRRGVDLRRQVDSPPELATSLANLGWFLYLNADYEEAQGLVEEALAIQQSLPDQELASAETLSILGAVFFGQGEYEAATARFNDALEIRRRLLGGDHQDVARLVNNLGLVRYQLSDYHGAIEHLRESLRIHLKLLRNDHPSIATIMNNLAISLMEVGDARGAEELQRQALAIRRRILDPAHPDIAQSLHNLGLSRYKQGDLDGAEPLFREALEVYRVSVGERHAEVVYPLKFLGMVHHLRGHLDQAERYLREALAIDVSRFGAEHPGVTETAASLADVLSDQGRYNEAEQMYRHSLGVLRQAESDWQGAVPSQLIGLGLLLTKKGRPAEAEAYLREAVEILAELVGRDHTAMATADAALGSCLAARRQFAEAEPLLIAGYSKRAESYGEGDPRTQQVVRDLVDLYDAWQKPQAAARFRANLLPSTADRP